MKPSQFLEEEIQILRKYFKRHSPSLVTREMQTKTTFRFHLTPVRMAKIKTTNDGEDVENRQPSCTADGSENWYHHCRNQVLQKHRNRSVIQPNYPTPGYIPKGLYFLQRHMLTPCVQLLYSIARTKKEPRFLVPDEWILRKGCIYTMGFYTAVKKNEICR